MFYFTIILFLYVNSALTYFDYYMSKYSMEFITFPNPSEGFLTPIYNIVKAGLPQTTIFFDQRAYKEATKDYLEQTFYGCFLTNQFVDYGPTIIGDTTYQRDYCGWECSGKYKDFCDGLRTLVGIVEDKACICICDEYDVSTAEKAPPAKCSNADSDAVTVELQIVWGTARLYFRVMSVCNAKTWGTHCQAKCNCEFPICDRNNGKCLKGKCEGNYTGDACDLLDTCLSHNCKNGGTCEVIDNENYLCQCSKQTYGDKCEYFYDFAGYEGSETLPEKDFEVMLDWLESGKHADAIDYEEASYFGCFQRKNSFERFHNFQKHLKIQFPENCLKECKLNGKTLGYFTNNKECFCGELEDIHLERRVAKEKADGYKTTQLKEMESGGCTRCSNNSNYQCTDHNMAIYTSCKLTSYMYRGKCQNKCHCMKKLPCSVKNGKCPGNLCEPGFTGKTCNREDPEFVMYKGLEELDEGIQMAHFTCIFTVLLFLFACFSILWSFKTCYNVFFLHPMHMKDIELEEMTRPLGDDM